MNREDSQNNLYEAFVERHFETGSADIPGEWPEDVRERCLFFLRVIEESSGEPTSRSVLSDLEEDGVSATLELASPDGLPLEEISRGDERYVIEREIARGGMGRILLAYDGDLRRRIAMKILPAAGSSPARASRFLEEAQATAQLEHPNIGPVYDVGLDASRSPFFTMKWIRGRDLEELLRSADPEFTLIRLVQIVQQAAMGVDFAHSRGVVHRDLKPQNIMVGDYGEVLVVDWGLAKILRRAGRTREPDGGKSVESGISTTRGDRGVATLDGSVQGSVAYMAPEQARGEVDEIDPRTDVFGLGGILYRILAGSPVYPEADLDAALSRARRCEVVPPSRRAPGRPIPPDLESICTKALAPRKEDRFQSARELHDAVQRHVEGIHDAERRAREARRLLDGADRMRVEWRLAAEKAADLERREEALRSTVPDHAPEARKGPLWELVAEARTARERAEQLLGDATAAYGAVPSVDPGNRDAGRALAEIFHERMMAAEERGDAGGAKLYESLVRQHGDERHVASLREESVLRIETDSPGALVFIARSEERGLLLVETEEERLGVTPLERGLPRGSYVAILRKDGCTPVRFPFLLDRRPALAVSVRLHPEGSIPEGFIQVAGGESIIGGDAQIFSCLPRSRRWIPELFAARFPVTLGEYCEFLSERSKTMEDQGREVRPEGRTPLPPLSDLMPSFGKEEYAVRGEDGGFIPAPRLDHRMPAMGILYSAMLEYCAWLGRKLGREVRLPEESEWERCARGADGRLYPWGNRFDWALCKGGRSREGDPFLEPVGAFPRDRSPFGVRDLAGTIREACSGRDPEGYGPCRGGSWFNPYAFVFRADARTMYAPRRRATDIGFRVVFSK